MGWTGFPLDSYFNNMYTLINMEVFMTKLINLLNFVLLYSKEVVMCNYLVFLILGLSISIGMYLLDIYYNEYIGKEGIKKFFILELKKIEVNIIIYLLLCFSITLSWCIIACFYSGLLSIVYLISFLILICCIIKDFFLILKNIILPAIIIF